MTTIAVTIPAYGDSPLLREAVASVLAQRAAAPGDEIYRRLQVFDDGPPDPVLADWFGGLGPQVSYERNPERLGINGNFQRCLDRAEGEFVVVLGADDRLLPDYVATIGRAARAYPTAAWFHPRVQVVDAAGRPATSTADRIKARLALRPPAYVGGEALAVSLLRGNWMYFPSVAFRTEVVRAYGFRPGLDIVQDLDLYLRMLLGGCHAMLLDARCFEYRRHDASLSSVGRDEGGRFAEERDYFAMIAQELESAGWRRAARAARVHLTSRLHAATVLPAALAGRRWAGARDLLQHAVLP